MKKIFAVCFLITLLLVSAVTPIGTLADGEALSVTFDGTEIGTYAGNKEIQSVTITNSLAVPAGAFAGCTELTSVSLDSVDTIESFAFAYCSALPAVTIPASVDFIGVEAFCYCTNLESVTILNPDVAIGENAFVGCADSFAIRAIPGGRVEFYAGENNIPFVPVNAEGEEIQVYLVSYDANGGTGAPASHSKMKDIPLTLSTTVPTKTGYRFMGWATSPSGSVAYQSGASYTENAALNLYAVWEEILVSSVSLNQTDLYLDLYQTATLSATVLPNDAFDKTIIWSSSDDTVASVSDGVVTAKKVGTATITVTSESGQKTASCLVTVTYPTIASGSCGTNATYTLDANGTLYIKGTGEMKDYNSSSVVPWKAYAASIKNVIISENITSIGNYAFYNCTGLTSINIPEGITSIGGNAFYNCTGLTSINIPEGITSIGGNAFRNCSSLSSITIPPSVTTIGPFAFDGCENLKTVNISSLEAWCNVSCIDSFVLCNAEGLTLNGELITDLVIPEGVTTINGAFEYCKSLTSVTIPDHVTSLFSAFYFCENLTTATIGNGITEVVYAFLGCHSLRTVTFKEGAKIIENDMFIGCENLTSVTIPASVTKIGLTAFAETNKNKLTIYAPAVSQGIGFAIDNGYKYVVTDFLEGTDVIHIGLNHNTYQMVPGETVQLTATVYPENAVNKTVTWASSDETVATVSGGMVTALKDGEATLTITSADGKVKRTCLITVKTVSPQSGTCGNSVAYTLDASGTLTIMGTGAMEDYGSVSAPWYDVRDSIKKVVINEGVTTIGRYAFDGCNNLMSVIIPNSVTTIKGESFTGCSKLSAITIPKSVTVIEAFTFYRCNNLKTVYIEDIGAWCQIAFGGGYAAPTAFAEEIYINGELITDLELPDGLTTINDYAFEDFLPLRSITIPSSVENIGEYAFWGYYTENLTFRVMPGSVAETYVKEKGFTYEYINAITSVTLNKTAHEMEAGETVTLAATVLPDNATDKSVTWTSSDEEVATVLDGVVTALKAGTAVITATASDGEHKAECTITVTETIVIINPPSANISGGLVAKGTKIKFYKENKEQKIYYTTNGDAPTTESTLYVSGIVIQEDTVIKAITVSEEGTSAVVTFTYTVPGETVPAMIMETKTATRGKTVTVSVALANNPGILGMQYKLRYAEGLTLNELTAGDALTSLEFTKPGTLAPHTLTILWDGMEEDTGNGIVLNMTFTVNEDAMDGFHAISLTPEDVYDDYGDVELTMVNGGIEVIPYVPGDINGDGDVSTRDVTALRRYIAGGYDDVVVVEPALDVNGDGIISARDVTLLRKFIAGGYDVTIE